MKTNELRIGNKLIISDEIVTVTAIFSDTIHSTNENRNYAGFSLELYKGIPLTEEWLLKFGFYKNDENYYVKENQTSIDLIKILFDEFNFYAENRGVVLREIKYIHQLQNLYFTLTGEELKIQNLVN